MNRTSLHCIRLQGDTTGGFPFGVLRSATTIAAIFVAAMVANVCEASDRAFAPFSTKEFRSITILENGRRKPLDTYARNKLLQFSGRQRLNRASAADWLARLFFNPAAGDFDKVFIINDPSVARSLGVAASKKRQYSYAELSQVAETVQNYYDSAIKTDHKNRSGFEREIVRIYSNLIEYRTLASAMSFAVPNSEFHINVAGENLPAVLTDPDRFPSFIDLLAERSFFVDNMTRIQNIPSDSLSEADKAIIQVTRRMFMIDGSISNTDPNIIPFIKNGSETWMSPWGLIAEERAICANHPSMVALKTMREAYLAADQSKFDSSVQAFISSARTALGRPLSSNASLELIYNDLNPFFYSKVILGLAAIFALIALFSTSRAVYLTGASGAFAAWALCSVGIVLRMLIMHHPPVTNLYETFIFVAWSTVLIGAALEFMRLRPVGLLTATLTGFIFMHVSGRYAADGDTLGMLAAVLNSGFWLTTHIITIALGYAGCLGAGFIGHIHLVQRIISPANEQLLNKTSRAVYGVLAFGMLFTVIGTVTGGMWADQAWGRFWGWDPKENGALLIILWCLMVFHFRLTRAIADTGFASGAIISGVLVMYTWIGVNLLGTGLHSYGFTASGASLLFGYAAFEALFLGTFAIVLAARRKKGATAKPPAR